MKPLALLTIALGLLAPTGVAQTYLEVPDVPTDLPAGGSTFLPWDIVSNDGGVYGLVASLPPNTFLDGVHRLPAGDWLLSVEVPTELPVGSGTFWDPRDVFRWDGAGTFLAHAAYAGAVALIPADSNVDAVFTDPTGAVVVSFDVPTTIGAVTYEPADLVRYDGVQFNDVPYMDAGIIGVPSSTDLTAADRRGSTVSLSFDIPTTVGASTFLPGEVLVYNGASLAVFDPQPGWPANRSSRLNAMTSAPVAPGTNPGEVEILTVDRIGPMLLELRWTAGDCGGAVDHGVYQGSLASLRAPVPAYDHTRIDCADAFPYLTETVALPAGDAYFLVVAHSDSAGEEGSYGSSAIGGVSAERPTGTQTCTPTQSLGCP